MDGKTRKSFQIFYLRKPETAAMFFPVPRQTASRLTPLIHFKESVRSFGMQHFGIPPCGHHAFPLFSVLARAAASNPFTRNVTLVSTYKEDVLLLRGVPT